MAKRLRIEVRTLTGEVIQCYRMERDGKMEISCLTSLEDENGPETWKTIKLGTIDTIELTAI